MHIFNEYFLRVWDLEDGYEWCPKCRGKGIIEQSKWPQEKCDNCGGWGQVVWINKITKPIGSQYEKKTTRRFR